MCLGDVLRGYKRLLLRSMTLVVSALLLCGCGTQQSCLQQNFPPELVSKAHSDFKTDITDWEIPAGWTVPTRARLELCCEAGVGGEVKNYCREKLDKCLAARKFEIDPNEQNELTVCIVKAAEIRKPVRGAKVRIAVKFSPRLRSPRPRSGQAEQASPGDAEPAMVGIADGIEPRPDLSSGVWMPKAAYCRAAQYAIAKIMDQLDNIPKRTPSQP
jgi:hypothetical protein